MGGKFADINDTVPTGRAPLSPSPQCDLKDRFRFDPCLNRFYQIETIAIAGRLFRENRVTALLRVIFFTPTCASTSRRLVKTRPSLPATSLLRFTTDTESNKQTNILDSKRPCQPSLLHANFSRIFRYTRENHESAITVSTVFKFYWSLSIDKSREECACAVQ